MRSPTGKPRYPLSTRAAAALELRRRNVGPAERFDWDAERLACAADPVTFISRWCHIFDKAAGRWVPFRLWPEQQKHIPTYLASRRLCILKARQLGFTWWALSLCVWEMLFRPIQEVLLFSQTDAEAKELTAHRMAGVWDRIPAPLRGGDAALATHRVVMPNGSRATSFATTKRAGRSYAATSVLIDEADYIAVLDDLLTSVQSTVDAGGRMVVMSTADKAKPASPFKRLFRAAVAGENEFTPIFSPWSAHPDRDQTWYDTARAADFATNGCYDASDQEYPETIAQALAPRSLDKRIPPAWLHACYEATAPLSPADLLLSHFSAPAAPSLPYLRVFRTPKPGGRYVIGADPAEGNPASDESALCVIDEDTAEQVAVLAGRVEPDVFAGYAWELAKWFNFAAVLVERNNHGHAVIMWLRDNASGMLILPGYDLSPGWLTNSRGKALLYDGAVTRVREKRCVVRDDVTFYQLCSIEGATQKAPEGEHDDRATAFVLALAAIDQTPRGRFEIYT